MGRCALCGKESRLVSEAIGVCADCLRRNPEEALRVVRERRARARAGLGLPPEVPRAVGGVRCVVCGNRCSIPEGGTGYCGLMRARGGRLVRRLRTPYLAVGEYYLDPHPTNCVADWVCPGATGAGYPRYAVTPGPERGYYNIAVFYGACSMDCAYCQNWVHKRMAADARPVMGVEDLASAVSERTTCACFFGGDPGPQMVHALASAEAMLERAEEIGLRVFRICWETNGLLNPALLDKAVELSLRTGGIVKIDLKAWSPPIYEALTGNDGSLVKANIERVAKRFGERDDPPLLVISTLLVPGYVDEVEIEGIASFVASLNPDIPVHFLAFHPDYLMTDLPPTSRAHAEAALRIAREAGLRRVSLGNTWLLGNHYGA